MHRVQKPGALPRRRVRRAREGLGARRGARLPRVPRCLRHRDEPPRLQDPLQDPERRPAHARRARVRAVGRHGGASSARAACRSCRCESARPLRDFDVVGFSLQFELTYTNVLADARPRRHPAARPRDRGEDDPLVIAGGPTATHPEPLAPFLDAFVIGDGEERATEVALVVDARCKKQGVPRARAPPRAGEARAASTSRRSTRRSVDADTGFTVVDRAARARGAPLPVVRTLVDDLNQLPFPDDGPIGGPEAIFDRMSIEIARGCTEGCRFCQAGMIYRPVRERDPEQIVDTVVARREEERLRRGEPHVALDRRLLVHRAAREEGGRRARAREGLARRLVAARLRARARTCSTTSQRVRATRRDVRARGGHASGCATSSTRTSPRSSSWRRPSASSRAAGRAMKLYFMIGLPTEEEEDVREIPQVGGRARAIGKRVKRERGQRRARRRSPSASRPTSPSRTRPSSGARWTRPTRSRAEAGAGSRRRRATAKRRPPHARLRHVVARGRLRARRPLARATCSSARTARGARFDSWEDQLKIERLGGGVRGRGRRPGDVPRHDPRDGAPAVGPHRRRARRGLPRCASTARRSKNRLSLAVRQGRGRVRARDEPRRTRGRRRASSSATTAASRATSRAMRERAPRLPAQARRRRAARRPRRRSPRAARPRAPPPRDRRRASRAATASSTRSSAPRAFLSHLDLIRALPRAFRRLELPLFYSQGFHPKPDMTFGPALSLGVASLGEVVDVKIAADLDAGVAARGALGRGRTDGLRFVGGVRLGPRDAAVSRIVDTARYAVGIPRSVRRRARRRGVARERVARGARGERRCVVMRRIDGIGKRVDVREFLRDARGRATRARELAGARRHRGRPRRARRVEVEVRGSGGVKIAEVVEALVRRRRAAAPRGARRRSGACGRTATLVSPLDLDARARRARSAARRPRTSTTPGRRTAVAPTSMSARARRRAARRSRRSARAAWTAIAGGGGLITFPALARGGPAAAPRARRRTRGRRCSGAVVVGRRATGAATGIDRDRAAARLRARVRGLRARRVRASWPCAPSRCARSSSCCSSCAAAVVAPAGATWRRAADAPAHPRLALARHRARARRVRRLLRPRRRLDAHRRVHARLRRRHHARVGEREDRQPRLEPRGGRPSSRVRGTVARGRWPLPDGASANGARRDGRARGWRCAAGTGFVRVGASLVVVARPMVEARPSTSRRSPRGDRAPMADAYRPWPARLAARPACGGPRRRAARSARHVSASLHGPTLPPWPATPPPTSRRRRARAPRGRARRARASVGGACGSVASRSLASAAREREAHRRREAHAAARPCRRAARRAASSGAGRRRAPRRRGTPARSPCRTSSPRRSGPRWYAASAPGDHLRGARGVGVDQRGDRARASGRPPAARARGRSRASRRGASSGRAARPG